MNGDLTGEIIILFRKRVKFLMHEVDNNYMLIVLLRAKKKAFTARPHRVKVTGSTATFRYYLM